MCVCVCVRACVRACVCVCARECVRVCDAERSASVDDRKLSTEMWYILNNNPDSMKLFIFQLSQRNDINQHIKHVISEIQ